MVLHSYVVIPVFSKETNMYVNTIRLPIDHPLTKYNVVTDIDTLNYNISNMCVN